MVVLEKEVDFERNDYDLEEFMIFCVMVAGKKASTTVKLLDDMLRRMHSNVDPDKTLTPFALIKEWLVQNPFVDFGIYLKQNGFGCYNHREKAVRNLISSGINLRTCSLEDLERLYGVGQKTSRFFLMCNRPNIKAAILDRHILRYLSGLGYNVPENTPTSKSEYLRTEKLFLREVEKNGADPMQFDYEIWKKAAKIE